MNSRNLWSVCITTTTEAEEAVAELLRLRYGDEISSYTNLETGLTTVTAFFASKPDAASVRATLRPGLARIRRHGLRTGPGRIRVRRIRRADWAEAWKRHFKPIEIGGALLIKPGWSRRRPRKGQSVVILDPGLGFGTGQHPTTAFCLRQLVARRAPATRQSFLDIGTGSGILAIAAARLAYAPVEAIDIDPEAVRVARANARRNGVFGQVRIRQADVRKFREPALRKHDLVCANLIATLLVSARRRILSRLKTGGVLVVAGILGKEFATVRRAFAAAGLQLIASRLEKGWRSGVFRR